MRRTPWWHYVVAVALGLLGGMLLARVGEASNLSLLGASWVVSALLLVVGIVVLMLTLQIHRYATTDPRKRAERNIRTPDPQRAVSVLMLAKALGLAGAALAGWYGGQLLMCLGHGDAPYYSRVITECAVAVAVSLIDMVIGIIGEWLCQLPPTEGPEHPKMREAGRARGVASAATATRNRTDRSW